MNSSDLVNANILMATVNTIQNIVLAIDSGATIVAMTLRPKQINEAQREPDISVPTERLVYPPEMMAAIRKQKLDFWQDAYNQLNAMGVSGVPRPPTISPEPY